MNIKLSMFLIVIVVLSFVIFLFAEYSFCKPLFVVADNVWSLDSPVFLVNTNVESNGAHRTAGQQESRQQSVNAVPKVNFLKYKLKTAQKTETTQHLASEIKASEILAMVFVSSPKTKYPIKAFKDFAVFSKKHQQRKGVIYALLTPGGQKNACLYQFDAKTGEEMFAFPLPCPLVDATLIVEDVYFANNWHSLLILTIQTENNADKELLVFDVTDPFQFKNSSLLWQSHFPNNGFRALSEPKIIYTSSGQWGILMGGKIANEASIFFIPFQFPNKLLQIKACHSAGFLTLLPMDLNCKGYVDRIYAIDDKGQLWEADFREMQKSLIEKITNSPLNVESSLNLGSGLFKQTKVKILKSIDTAGLELLAIEGDASNVLTRLLNINAYEKTNSEELKKHPLAKGQYLDFYLTTHSLLLIPKYSDQHPEFFARTRKGYEKIHCAWQSVSKDASTRKLVSKQSTAKKRLQAEIIWDVSRKQTKILTLDEDGQLDVLSPIWNSQWNSHSPENLYQHRVALRRNIRHDGAN